MVKLKSCLKWLFVGLIVLFIYAPILLLTVYSFNETERITSWKGFSLELTNTFSALTMSLSPLSCKRFCSRESWRRCPRCSEPSAPSESFIPKNEYARHCLPSIRFLLSTRKSSRLCPFSSSSSLCTSIKAPLFPSFWDKWFCVLPLSFCP